MDNINKMYSIFKGINNDILKKDNVSFMDKYVFEATSYFMSIVHEKVISKNVTYTTIYMYKSLIEVVSIIYMYMGKEKEFDELKLLLDGYNNKIENDIYNKYKDILDINLFRLMSMKKK